VCVSVQVSVGRKSVQCFTPDNLLRIVEALTHVVLRLPEPVLTACLNQVVDAVLARMGQYVSIASTIEVSAPLTVEVNLLTAIFKVYLSIGSSIPETGPHVSLSFARIGTVIFAGDGVSASFVAATVTTAMFGLSSKLQPVLFHVLKLYEHVGSCASAVLVCLQTTVKCLRHSFAPHLQTCLTTVTDMYSRFSCVEDSHCVSVL
jgi:hypothetical protein